MATCMSIKKYINTDVHVDLLCHFLLLCRPVIQTIKTVIYTTVVMSIDAIRISQILLLQYIKV